MVNVPLERVIVEPENVIAMSSSSGFPFVVPLTTSIVVGELHPPTETALMSPAVSVVDVTALTRPQKAAGTSNDGCRAYTNRSV